ncbi:MAG: hypothetical protein LBG59_06045 [Candidatus Peribacteria bacterium]|nr:hypothetical protein [Candidatus Peribacteria bacterium]
MWGNLNEGTDQYWYQNHLLALRNAKIITNIDPTLVELRARVFLQLYRATINVSVPLIEIVES